VSRERSWVSGGRQSDLVFSIKDLVFVVDDVGGKTADLAGKTKNLEVKETKTEIHIDLAADVLFDFDKSTLRPKARGALKQAASIIRDNAKGSTVRIDGYTDSKGSIFIISGFLTSGPRQCGSGLSAKKVSKA
jgi:OmpA family